MPCAEVALVPRRVSIQTHCGFRARTNPLCFLQLAAGPVRALLPCETTEEESHEPNVRSRNDRDSRRRLDRRGAPAGMGESPGPVALDARAPGTAARKDVVTPAIPLRAASPLDRQEPETRYRRSETLQPGRSEAVSRRTGFRVLQEKAGLEEAVMLFLKFVLLLAALGLLPTAAGIVAYDIYLSFELNRLLERRRPKDAAGPTGGAEPRAGAEFAGTPPAPAGHRIPAQPRRAIRWGFAAKLILLAGAASFVRASIVVVPDGMAAVRISQISGVLPGTLYSGMHLIFPLTQRVEYYDVRDRMFFTGSTEGTKEKHEELTVESKEGLEVGLGVTVRYCVDPRRLDYIQANLPRPLDEQIVAPMATSVFRELAPDYIVRDMFSTKREEFRAQAAKKIAERLAGDGIVVKEVMLRKVDLPQEYAQGLEGLLLKEQQDDQTSVDAEIEQKRVKIAESQAEAAKVREVKRAEADAASRVIMAKAESDSMQYTLPLKQKQIEQSRLEAEARKEATIQNAEADAQAKVIDSKADQQREELLAEGQKNAMITNAEADAEARQISSKAALETDARLADAEANRTRVTGRAEAEQLEMEAAALRENPLLVQYTVAQRLSDKVQIMLVPADGKYFFTNDALQSAVGANGIAVSRPSGNK